MKIVVIGGTGLIGRQLVSGLRERGHQALAASPSRGVDAVTGAGLGEALAGADVVVDVANSPTWEDEAVLRFFETSSLSLVTAEQQAGVGHHVALSIVGVDRMLASGYMRAKLAQERVIAASSVPYTILRATQFFEFLGPMAAWWGRSGPGLRVPDAKVQTIASSEVAAALADVALAAPTRGIVELGGPEAVPAQEMMSRYLRANDDGRAVEIDPAADYFGTPLEVDSLITTRPDALRGKLRFESWARR